MADRENSIKTTVEIDANQAQQEIARLNGIASDSTQEVEDRLAAKNKQAEIQNKLSKQTIQQQEKELEQLKESGASRKEILKAQKKLNAAKLKATKATASNTKAQNKLNDAYESSKDPIEGLDRATGGLLGQMKAFLANPIGATIAALVAVFKVFQKAIQRSEKATEAFNKVGAFLEGIMNGLLAVLEPIVEFLGEALVKAIENPKQAFTDLGNIIKKNVINRFKALGVLGESIKALFSGDLKEAGKLAADGFLQLGTGVENVTDKVKDFANSVKEDYKEAADATYDLANAQRQLVKNQIELDKNQLQFQKRAEELRQIRDDTSLSTEKRIKANKELGRVLDEQAKAELSLAQQNLELAEKRLEAEGDTIENIQAVGDAEVKVAEIQERITSQRSEQLMNINTLLEEQKKKEEEAAKRRKAEAKAEEERRQRELEKEQERQERELEAQLEQDEIEIERRRAKGERVLELELELLQKRKEQELNNENLLESERTAIIESYALKAQKIKDAESEAKSKAEEKYKENAIKAAGEAFGISKELSLAKMLINLPETISESIKSGAGLPFPANVAAVASNLATQVPPIVKGIQTIKSVSGPSGSGGGGGGASTASASASSGGGATASITDLAANNAARTGQDPSLSRNANQMASDTVQGGTKANVVFSEDSYNDFQGQVQYKEDKTSF